MAKKSKPVSKMSKKELVAYIRGEKKPYGPGNIDFHIDRASDRLRTPVRIAKSNPLVGNRYSVREIWANGKTHISGSFNTRKEAEGHKKKLVAFYKKHYGKVAQPRITISVRKSRKVTRVRKNPIDNRYSVRKEFTGKAKPQFVARFMGDWIGSASTEKTAKAIASKHNKLRLEDMGISTAKKNPAQRTKWLIADWEGKGFQVQTKKSFFGKELFKVPKLMRKFVDEKTFVEGSKVALPKIRLAKKNPVPAFIIRVKLKTREHPFYFDGYRLDANRNNAQKYASLQHAKQIGQKVWRNFPSVATVGIHKVRA